MKKEGENAKVTDNKQVFIYHGNMDGLSVRTDKLLSRNGVTHPQVAIVPVDDIANKVTEQLEAPTNSKDRVS